LRLLSVGIGGILGTLTRYAVSLFLNDKGMLPWGTFAVNIAGCFLIALFLSLVLHRFNYQSPLVLAIVTGFTGSFTTFSALSVEGLLLLQASVALALFYLGLTILGGFVFTWLGYTAGQYILTTDWARNG